MDSETRHEIAQREGTKPDKAAVKGILAQFMAYIESQGYIKDSDGEHTYVKLIRLLIRKGANILDPEDVKKVIAQQQSWKNGVKRMVVCAYDVLTKVLKITWTPPEYRQEDTLPFIPEEKELDALIIGARSRRMTAFLQTLKETFADPSEALGLRWIDLGSQNNTITINRPVRRARARYNSSAKSLTTSKTQGS